MFCYTIDFRHLENYTVFTCKFMCERASKWFVEKKRNGDKIPEEKQCGSSDR